MEKIELQEKKKIYFASDFHLGAPNHEKSLVREKEICSWLNEIKNDAQAVFLVGDLFDFWFEYKNTVPKGYSRFFGKLSELSDAGIEIIIFPGNHDMWMKDYFSKEFSAKTYRKPMQFKIKNKLFYISHGDGLGPGDYAYKVLKRIFENKICRFLFGNILHPNLSLRLGYIWAAHSWKNHEKEQDVYVFKSNEKEILYHYCKEIEAKEHHDFYVFGHRHYKLDIEINKDSRYINLGDWIYFFSYAVFDGENLQLLDWQRKTPN